jgi:ATP-dependent helicase/nuclease subunit A
MTRAETELYITGSLSIKDDETDDFSLKLKNFIEEKCKKNENYIKNDSIWNNDTFFGLLLPSIVSHIPLDGLKTNQSFFNLEEISVLNKTESPPSNNNQRHLNEFIKKAVPVYEKCKIIKTPVLYDNHITPVSLQKDEEDIADENTAVSAMQGKSKSGLGLFTSKEFSGDKSDDIFDKVDVMLSRFSQSGDETSEKFNSGGFGTIAHICVEAHLKNKEAIIPSNIACLLKPSELTVFLEAGREIAKRFVLSPLGKAAESAELRENEFSFRSLIKNKEGKEVFISGTIDLFFEYKDCIHIVDFKTDTKEIPAEHTAQMACYYHAVSAIFSAPAKKECRIWLYYLRTGHAVEMTEKVKRFNIEQRAFNQ